MNAVRKPPGSAEALSPRTGPVIRTGSIRLQHPLKTATLPFPLREAVMPRSSHPGSIASAGIGDNVGRPV